MKKVVYTALTGSYDALEQHQYVNPEYNYICFSNDFGDKKKIGIWTIRKIDYPSDDKQLQSRYPKLQPHEVLPEYDISLYVDANVNILTPYIFKRIEELLKEGVLLAGVKHQFRDCLYEEGYRVWIGGVDKNIDVIRRQLSYYKQDGFPRHFGMYEANVIFRQHNDPLIIKQCDEWWRLRLNYSKRDQLGYSYSLWKYNIPFVYLLPEDQWTRNSKEVTCRVRPQKYPYFKQKVVNAYYKFYIPLKQKIGFPIFYKAL